MDTIEFYGWHIVAFPEKTRLIYEQVYTSGAETCNCVWCRNFVLSRREIYPEPLLVLFNQLGINRFREAEVDEYTGKNAATHYLVDFFFSGALLDDDGKPVAPKDPGARHKFPFKKIGDNTEIRITQMCHQPWFPDKDISN